MDLDAIVIGTGFGGAVSAANLARAGMQICVLERGTWWGRYQRRRPLPESPLAVARALNSIHRPRGTRGLSLQLSKKGLIEVHAFPEVRVTNGIGVGGSSLLYGGLSQRPADDFFDGFPAEITLREMEKYFLAIEEALQPSLCPTRIDAAGHLEKHAPALGGRLTRLAQVVQWGEGPERDHAVENRFGVRQYNCNLCNNCTPGCNRGAKNSLDLTLLPAAQSAGAELRDLCAVDAIEESGGGYAVHFRELRSRRRATLRAPRVVLAAGTVNTHKILFRSRSQGLPRLSRMLGKQISLGGDTMCSYPRRADPLPLNERGHSIEDALEFADESGRRDHFVFPGGTPFLESRLLRPFRSRRRETLSLVGFGRDGADGEFSWDGRRLDFSAPEQPVVGRIYADMFKLAQTYGQRDGGPPVGQWHEAPRPRRVEGSVHPMGGCRMGASEATGVVDHRGEVFGHPGLYVADASLFAGPPVAAPSMSIAAFAWRISELIIEEAGRSGAG